jgi:hypothetical protein
MKTMKTAPSKSPRPKAKPLAPMKSMRPKSRSSNAEGDMGEGTGAKYVKDATPRAMNMAAEKKKLKKK